MANEVAAAYTAGIFGVVAAGLSSVLTVVLAVINNKAVAAQSAASDKANKELSERTRKAEEALEFLKSKLSRENDAAKAQQDYEFDSRKRMYEDLYPLVFQFSEAAQKACDYTENLARAAREGNLSGKDGWLNEDNPYYFTTIVHSLLVPASLYSLMSMKLTLFDVRLDKSLHWQVTLAKAIYKSWLKDYALSSELYPAIVFDPAHPELKYAPIDSGDPAVVNSVQQRRLYRQGVFSGLMGTAAEALHEANGQDSTGQINLRVMSYGHFLHWLGGKELRTWMVNDYNPPDLVVNLHPVSDLFRDFHPATRPVTWRILLTHAVLCRAFVDSCSPSYEKWTDKQILDSAFNPSDVPEGWYAWSGGNTKTSTDLGPEFDFKKEQEDAYLIAQLFLTNTLKKFRDQYDWRKTDRGTA